MSEEVVHKEKRQPSHWLRKALLVLSDQPGPLPFKEAKLVAPAPRTYRFNAILHHVDINILVLLLCTVDV